MGSTALAYEAVGDGIPLVALHGAYSTREEVRGFLEPIVAGLAVRRIYPDLPGHGASRPSDDVRSPETALDLLEAVLEAEVSSGSYLLLGHSYGAHFARAMAARHPERVAGLALLCAVMPGEQHPADWSIVRDDWVSDALDDDLREQYEGYFVVRTADTLERFRRDVVPSLQPVDEATLETAIEATPVEGDAAVGAPVVVLSGRRDAVVGWERQQELAAGYPRGTSVTVADAGHALPHERPLLVGAVLRDWLEHAGATVAP